MVNTSTHVVKHTNFQVYYLLLPTIVLNILTLFTLRNLISYELSLANYFIRLYYLNIIRV